MQIFDEQPATLNSRSSNNAIVLIQLSEKVTVDLNNPGKPAPGTVKEGYDSNMDMPRPGYLDEYLESVLPLLQKGLLLIYHLVYYRNYNIIFIIDDSGSVIRPSRPFLIIFF